MDGIIIILIILIIVCFGGKSSGKSSGGYHVKPKTKTPRPKVRPAPQLRKN